MVNYYQNPCGGDDKEPNLKWRVSETWVMQCFDPKSDLVDVHKTVTQYTSPLSGIALLTELSHGRVSIQSSSMSLLICGHIA